LKLATIPFNLDVTLCCGQVFRWEKTGDWWYGIVRNRALKVRQVNAELEFANVDERFIRDYFGLSYDLNEISVEIGRDVHVRNALRMFWGLRIVRQEPWECLASYICATYKSIMAIKNMLFKLSKKFGERIKLEGCTFYTFPTPENLAKASEKELEDCGLGYRAKYLLETSKKIVDGDFDLDGLTKMSYHTAKNKLLGFPGVGYKVADCVLLFSLGKFEAFPVDVWIKRVLLRHYGEQFPDAFIRKISQHKSLSNIEYQTLNEFGRNYFGKYAGYAQEYLFHCERMQG
jgi:N-glycosylase/DNA lyase